MIVTYDKGIFIATCSYLERDIPRLAGFIWDRLVPKRWATRDPRTAAALLRYCDLWASAEIHRLQGPPAEAEKARPRPQETAPSADASRATDADIEIPAPAGLEYLGYQRAGIAYAMERTNTIIGDEMGLGKTVQALGLINADPSISSALIICPASLRLNWRREAKRWLCRPLSVGIALNSFPATDVVVVNYDRLGKHRDAIRRRNWDLLVADEAHYLKNPKAQRTREVFGRPKRGEVARIDPIRARRRLFLTGTPLLNRPVELWPILHACGWKNWLQYVTRYCAAQRTQFGWDVSGASHLDELQARLRSELMVRRLKADVLTELPPKRRQIIEVTANGAARAVGAELELLRRLCPGGGEDDYLEAVSRLQQRDFAGFAELSRLRHETALAKVPAVVEHVTECFESGTPKLVLFGHHKDALGQVRADLEKAGLCCVMLTGDMKSEDRQRSVDRFQSEAGVQVFLGTIGAAGVGLTLTAASHVVFSELDWVPGNMSQAEDRCHRIGQRDSVLVQHLVFEGSLDALVAQTLVRKQAVIDAALDTQ